VLSQIIERHLATFSRPSTKRLIHGQLHTQNILSKKSREICVIDFGESIGMSSPLQDLYVLLSSHDGWSKGTGNRAQREAILKGYGGIDAAIQVDKDFGEKLRKLRA
jgi:Ser/Thr protein kinase RdoA (MazF antagonist)